MANVRCITMQQNEDHLLNAWVLYHGYLFGFENIYVLDNGSDNSNSIDKLKEFERNGVNVIWNYNTWEDFDQKGAVLSNIIKEWDHDDENYDFVITIDIDEFIFLRNSKIDISRYSINAYFDSLIGKQATFIINKMMLISPYSCELYASHIVPKSLFAKGTLASLDSGYHRPRTINNYPDLTLDLGYFHLHHKAFSEMKSAATAKLKNLVDVNDIEKLRSFTGAGNHLVKLFFMSENEYRHILDNNMLFFFPELFYRLKSLGVDVKAVFNTDAAPEEPYLAFLFEKENINESGFLFRITDNKKYLFGHFDDKFYLETQHDVRKNYPHDPLIHFSLHGYQEGRPWSRSKEKIEMSIEETN